MARKTRYAARQARPRPASARQRQGASPSAVGASRGLAGGVFAAGGLALAPSASAAPVLLRTAWNGHDGGPRLAPRSGLPHRFGDVALFPSGPGGVQAALKVSRPGDRHEREADRVAAAVLSMPAPRNGGRKPPAARQGQTVLPDREGAASSSTATPALESQLRAKGGGGKPLPPAERAFFEPRFGHDFSQVRVHDDARAARMARSLKARAFTVGRDVHFAKGQYQPTSREGKRLLAHELTHTVQQGSAPDISKTSTYKANLRSNPINKRTKEIVYFESTYSPTTIQPIHSDLNLSPLIQPSFISYLGKMAAKRVSKGILKNFIKTQIKSRIKKLTIKKFAKRFTKEADELIGILEDPWWVTGIGLIPIAGDVFDLVRVPMQIRKAMRKADKLEAKVKKILRIQGQWASKLVPDSLKRSKSYFSELGNKTYAEILEAAGRGSSKAKKMKKLIEQQNRISGKL